MNQKRSKGRSRTSTSKDQPRLLRQEDFTVLAEIQKVLNPYWSSRSGFKG